MSPELYRVEGTALADTSKAVLFRPVGPFPKYWIPKSQIVGREFSPNGHALIIRAWYAKKLGLI